VLLEKFEGVMEKRDREIVYVFFDNKEYKGAGITGVAESFYEGPDSLKFRLCYDSLLIFV
jgi:hypothetical protein